MEPGLSGCQGAVSREEAEEAAKVMAEEPTLEQLDDYLTASKWLIKKALSSGDGKMLRAIKTLMDSATKKAEAI